MTLGVFQVMSIIDPCHESHWYCSQEPYSQRGASCDTERQCCGIHAGPLHPVLHHFQPRRPQNFKVHTYMNELIIYETYHVFIHVRAPEPRPVPSS